MSDETNVSIPIDTSAVEASARRNAYLNIVLPLFVISVIAYIDRVNIGYAALTMNRDLGFGPGVRKVSLADAHRMIRRRGGSNLRV